MITHMCWHLSNWKFSNLTPKLVKLNPSFTKVSIDQNLVKSWSKLSKHTLKSWEISQQNCRLIKHITKEICAKKGAKRHVVRSYPWPADLVHQVVTWPWQLILVDFPIAFLGLGLWQNSLRRVLIYKIEEALGRGIVRQVEGVGRRVEKMEENMWKMEGTACYRCFPAGGHLIPHLLDLVSH